MNSRPILHLELYPKHYVIILLSAIIYVTITYLIYRLVNYFMKTQVSYCKVFVLVTFFVSLIILYNKIPFLGF